MLTFKIAEFNDLSEIVRIYNQTIPTRMATADLDPVTVESRYEWFHQHEPTKFPLWLIKVDENVAGWVGLSTFKARAAYDITAEISIYIDQAFHKQGLGQKTLTFVEEQLSSLDIETVVALIFGHNQASRRLFEKNGYAIWGTLPDVAILDGKYRDLLFIGKRYKPKQ